MKKILILCGTLVVVGLAGGVYWLLRPAHYGAAFTGVPAVSVQELVNNGEKHLDRDLRVEGEIVRQCPSSGCWFDLKSPDGKELRVEMSHLGTKLPQKKGSTAVVEGRLIRTETAFEFVGNGAEFH